MLPVEPGSIKATLIADMKTAMKAKERDLLETIRLINAAIKQVEVDTREAVTDADTLVILDKMAKQRRDSIEQFTQAGRTDLVGKEEFQLKIIQTYLPTALTDEELAALIDEAIQSSGATSAQDMGKVMAIIKPQAQGRADMRAVSGLVKTKLTS